MNFSDCRISRKPVIFVAALLMLACGCEPGIDVANSSDASSAVPVAVSPADQSTVETAPSAEPPIAESSLATPGTEPEDDLPSTQTFAPKAKKELTTSKAAQDAPADADASKEQTFAARCFCWNIESDGSDPEVIAKQMMEIGRYDIYALTEFLPSAKELFEETLGENYQLIMSRSGRHDRLVIAFDTNLYELIKSFEIEKINYKNRYRSPLVAQLKDKISGQEFFVMNNHLARGREGVREIQVKQLVAWARTQLIPVVAMGDYNLDYVFATNKGNSAFAPMLQDNVWKWIKPVELIDTNWYDNPEDPDGKDDYPGSLLDFAFVSGPAKAWKARCKVIVRPGDFPDDEKTSDHRPFELILSN